MKKQADKRAERRMGNAPLIADLEGKDFERILRVSARSGAPSDALLEAFPQRLQKDRVPVACFLFLLTEPLPASWKPLQEASLQAIVKRPELAVAVYTMATQIASWPPLACAVVQGGPQHMPVFRATVTFPGLPTVQADGATAKEAKQRATACLIAAKVGLPKPNFPKFAVTSPRAVEMTPTPAPARDPVSELQEYGQQKALAFPVYNFRMEGPPHLPKITCMCQFGGLVKSSTGGNKAEAKKAAARAILEALNE